MSASEANADFLFDSSQAPQRRTVAAKRKGDSLQTVVKKATKKAKVVDDRSKASSVEKGEEKQSKNEVQQAPKKKKQTRFPVLTYLINPATGFATSSVAHMPLSTSIAEYKEAVGGYLSVDWERYSLHAAEFADLVQECSDLPITYETVRLQLRNCDWSDNQIQNYLIPLSTDDQSSQTVGDFALSKCFVCKLNPVHPGAMPTSQTCVQSIEVHFCFIYTLEQLQQFANESPEKLDSLFLTSKRRICSTCKVEQLHHLAKACSAGGKYKMSLIDIRHSGDDNGLQKTVTKVVLPAKSETIAEALQETASANNIYLIVE